MLGDKYRQGVPAYEIDCEIPVKISAEKLYSSYTVSTEPPTTQKQVNFSPYNNNFRSSGKTVGQKKHNNNNSILNYLLPKIATQMPITE